MQLTAVPATGPFFDALRAASEASAGVVPVPQSITPRQFLLALLANGAITASEALAAAATGALPAIATTALAGLTPEQLLAARITFASMSEVERTSPLLALIVANGIRTNAQIDALFVAAAAL